MTAFAARYARHPYAIASIILAILFLCAFPVKAQIPVSLMPVVRQQFFGANGLPLAGGLVYTYVAGTSTPAPTYLDSTGTNLQTNPITLDSGGFASIWIPSPPIDVAVFNSSGTQQYKVLNVTALPLVVTSLTANFFQSSSTNPALSGFLRMASGDQACWRNNGNSADLCLNKNSSDNLFFGTHPFAFLDANQTFTGNNVFTNQLFIQEGGFNTTLTATGGGSWIYILPPASGTVCLLTFCSLTNPSINGVTVSGSPSGSGQTLVTTSPTTAVWGQGAITDYDSYGGGGVIGLTPPFTETLQTLPIGAVEDSAAVGSYIEGEVVINNVAYSGSAPVFKLNLNGTQIGQVTLASSASFDIRFTVALSSGTAPQAQVNILSSSPAVSSSTFTSGIPVIDGTAPVVLSYTVTTATSVTLSNQFVHMRVRF